MKNFTNNFKQFTSHLSARWLIMALMLLVGTSSAWAGGGAGGPMGVYLGVNGKNTWYKINGVSSWGMSCSGYSFDNAAALPSSLGDITSGLSLEGLGIIGWTDSGSDWVAGKINYTITPDSKTGSYETGNFENPSWGNGGHVRCSSGNNRVTAVKSSVNLINGLGVGDYTLKFEYFARMQWQNNNGNGYYDDNSGKARGTKSATFTVPGYSTTTGSLEIGDVNIGENSSKTQSLPHYGSTETAEAEVSGDNASEFAVTSVTATSITVKFTPTSTGEKTATVTVTDAYDKTYTLEVTGTGSKSCEDVSATQYPMSPVTFTYNGNTQVPTINPASEAGAVTLTEYKQEDTTVEDPTNVGIYDVYVTSGDGTTYCGASNLKVGSFEIECTEDITKENFSYILPTDAKYTENPHAVSVNWESGTTQTNGVITVYYKQGSGDYTNQAPTLEGTYTVAAKVTTAGNYCVSKNYIELGEFDIELAEQEDFDITTSLSVCGATTTLSATGGSGEGDITYKIGSTNTANARIEGGTTLMATKSGSVEITATKAGEEGKYKPISSTKTITITIPESPFTGNPQSTTICAGSTFNYDAAYNWYTSESGNQTVSGSATLNTTTEYYISQETNGCESARTKYTVNVDQPLVAPTLTLTNPTRCKDDVNPGSIVIDNYSNYDNSISFKLYNGDSPTGIPYENEYAISEEGSYKVEMVTTNSNVCGQIVYSDIKDVSITDNTPAATVSIADVDPICAGGSATLTCNVTPTQCTVKSYTWTLPNGSTQVTNTNTLSTGVIAEADTYNYSVVVTLENAGCTKDFTSEIKSVTVKEAPTAPNFGDNNSETVCQNTTVTLLTEYKGVQLKWYEYQNRTSPITSFEADAKKTVYAAAYNGTCESAELTAYTYNIYPVPTISVSASTTEATCHQMVTLTANTTNTVDGALVEWYEGETLVGTGNTYTFTKETVSEATITAKVRNYTTCAYVTDGATVSFTAHKECSTNSYVQGKIVYFKPNSRWKEAGARFAAYFYVSDSNNKWIDMLDMDKDGVYACAIPDGYSKVIFCRMDPNNSTNGWGSKWAQTENLTIPDNSKRLYSFENIKADNDWYPKDGKWSNLDAQKDFRTIALTPSSAWDKDGATFWAHAWSTEDQTMGFSSMVPSTEKGVYLVDIRTDYTDIMFERRQANGDVYDNGAGKHKTTDLKLDIYGNNYVITEAYHGGDDTKANGEWQWKWYANSYTLGLSTKASVTDGSTTINATGAFYRTDCAPGLEFGFKYIKSENEPTESNWASANARYVDNRPIAVGEEFTMNIDAAGGGIYWVRSYGRYNNNETYTYGNVVRVIVQGCTAGYEFEVANTSAVVQACGESRLLPAIEFLSNTEVAGETFTYQWKNEDDSDATNLSATNIATPTFNGKSSQNYKVIVAKMVGGQLKCSKTATYQVAYDDNSPKAIINDGAETITAEINEQLVLQGSAHYTESFTWTVKENEVDVTSTMLSDASILNPTFNTKEAGTYVVTLTAAGNQYCVAHTATATVKVNAPTEDCASSDIEIEYDFNSGVPSFFNDQNNVYYTYKTNNGDCVYTSLDNNNKLWKDNASFTINNLQESDFPITLYIVGGGKLHIGDVEARGYAEYTLNFEDHLGKKVICSATGGNSDIDTNVTSEICIGNDAKRKLKDANATMEVTTISGSTSAPTISSPKAVVNDDTKIATLSAYLAKTGCSTITNYGFQYIESDTEPSESDWTDSNKTTTQDLGNNIVIGKTFKSETTVLDQGKYWFRAYAKNAAGKTSYTSPISFEIIADGPYPVFIDAVQDHESEAALYINNEGKIVVKIYNKGQGDDDDVLEGSYKLIIENQNQNILFTPLIKNTPIEHLSSVTFTSKDKVANLDHYNITATLTYKGRKDTRNISKCTPILAAQDTDGNGLRDTIYYTIDAAAVTDKCMLVFPTVYEAVEHLKKSSEAEEDYQYTEKIGNGYILQQPVVMQVAYSTNRYKGNISVNTTGGGDKANALIIPIININNDDDDGDTDYNVDKKDGVDVTDKYYSLTIRALNENAMPTLQHIAIRDSRYITLDKLNIVASDDTKDNAIDIDCNNNSWVGNDQAKFKNTYVNVKNCNIKSKGFTCVHVSAVDKVHFLNNEITADLDNSDIKDDNVRCWGASVKFIRSNNLSFIRNNFMGTHATSIWLQEVDGALFMNNVLWNNNKIEQDIFGMFRIVQQTGNYYPANIGIYYNTLYLADNSASRSNHPKFNFLTLNSNDNSTMDDAIAHNGDFDFETIEFMYNNCYSYDTKTPGRPDVPFKYEHNTNNGTPREAWVGLCYNNFWSAKTGADFSFNGCSTIHNVNVKDNVCTTGATSPHSLVISGDKLNIGIKPATTLAVKLGADLLKSDRNRSNVRPKSTGWTLGAYQQTSPEEVSTIIWQGEAGTDWDNRNNWIDADTKRVLTCTHELASKLRVIIPAPHSEKYQVPGEEGVVNYPVIPVFNKRNTTLYGSELVNAGQKVGGANSGMFADVIEIEYGGSLQGVENLVNRYGEAKANFTAGRDQWTLVGTVVKPWTDNKKESTRNIKSGDYFIEKQTPHVYMHYAYMDGNTAKWSEPFTSKEESLEVTDVMAINLPNQYGEYKLTSQDYYTYSPDKDPEKLNDNVVPKNYEFVGKFVNEASLPSITGLKENEPVLLNNSYPCNIDPKKLQNGQGTVWMYDYKGGSFSLTSDDDVLIKPQHGFIFKPTGETYQVTNGMLVSGDTKSRSAEAEMPIFSLNLFNANSTEGEYSRVIVKYDELGDNGPVDLDLEKMFAENASTPELYIVMYDGKYQRVHVNSKEIVIPLGIRLMTSMNVSFQKFKAEGFDKVTLVDVVANKEYDLLSGKEVVTEKLLAGDIEGRFFLNLKETEEDDNIEGDDNVTTEIEEDSAEQSINILVEGENTVKVITNGVELENIYVSDMTGRTVGYKASGYSAVVELPVAQGVYTVNVIGDTASRTEKVILK